MTVPDSLAAADELATTEDLTTGFICYNHDRRVAASWEVEL